VLGWLDLSCGAAGDMLLGALVAAGAPLETVVDAVTAVGLPVDISTRPVTRAGQAALAVTVTPREAQPPHRRWRDLRALLEAAPLVPVVQRGALAVFAALAQAEGAVHGTDPEDVHFHEVGAHDAVADIVGTCAALHALRVERLVATPPALGGGTVRAAHGSLPVPVPAVLALLAAVGAPAVGGPVDVELTTPTGAALVTTLVDAWGPMPAMSVTAVGSGAGSRDLPDRPNVVRLVIGTAALVTV